MKLFLRTDPQTVQNALKMSLPIFKEHYKETKATERSLESAYHSIRNQSSAKSTFTVPESKIKNKGLSKTLISDLEDAGDPLMKVSLIKEGEVIPDPEVETDTLFLIQPPKVEKKVEEKKVATIKTKEALLVKSGTDSVAPKVKKSDRIRECLLAGLTPDETIAKLAEEGISTSKLWVGEIQLRIANEAK